MKSPAHVTYVLDVATIQVWLFNRMHLAPGIFALDYIEKMYYRAGREVKTRQASCVRGKCSGFTADTNVNKKPGST
jgi:hypothetical protein